MTPRNLARFSQTFIFIFDLAAAGTYTLRPMKHLVVRSLIAIQLILGQLILGTLGSLSWLFPSPAVAAGPKSVRGFVHTEPSGELYLTVRTSSVPLKIVPVGLTLLGDLSKLRDGDFIIGSGTLNANEKTVLLEAIESVGLQEVLGIWRADNWDVFEFRDFSRLNLYRPTADPGRAIRLAKIHELSYVLAPERGDSYSIFLSDDRSVQVGTLKVRDKNILLSVFDTSGRIMSNISLSPLSLR